MFHYEKSLTSTRMITDDSFEPITDEPNKTGQIYFHQLNEHIDFIKKYRHESDINIKDKDDQLAHVEELLETYKKKCLELQIENDRFQSKHEQHELFKEEIIQEIRTLTNCVEVLEGYILETRKGFDAYEETNNLYQTEKEKNITAIKELDTRLQAIKLEKDEQVNEIKAEALSESCKLQQQITELQTDSDKKQTEIKTLLDELKQKNLNINDMCTEILKNKTLIDELRVESRKNLRASSDLEANLKEVKAISATLCDKNQILQTDLDSEKLKNQENLKAINEKNLQNEKLKADLEESRKENSELKSQINELHIQTETLKQTINETNETNELKHKEQAELFKKKLHESLAELEAAHEAQLIELNDKLANEKQISKDMKILKEDLFEKSEMVEIFKNEIENQELKLKENLVQIENYANSHLEQTTLIKNLNDKIKKITENYETDLEINALQNNAAIEANNEVFAEKVNKLKLNEEKLKSVVTALKERLAINHSDMREEIKKANVSKRPRPTIANSFVLNENKTNMQPPPKLSENKDAGEERRVRFGNRMTLVQNKQKVQFDLKFNESFLDTIGSSTTQAPPLPQRSKRRLNVLTSSPSHTKNGNHSKIVTSTPIREASSSLALSKIKLSGIDKL